MMLVKPMTKVGVSLLLIAGCSQQPHNQRATSISNDTPVASRKCNVFVPYDEQKRLLIAIPEVNTQCTENTVQAIERAKDSAESSFICSLNLLYEVKRVIGGGVFLKSSSRHIGDNIDFYVKIADKALNNNCLNIADKMYRHVIESHIPTLSPYDNALAESLNSRAKIGIDDVRDAKNQANKK